MARQPLCELAHHRAALRLACGDPVTAVRHVADLGLGDGLDNSGCRGAYSV